MGLWRKRNSDEVHQNSDHDEASGQDENFLADLSDAVEMSQQQEIFSPEIERRQQRKNSRALQKAPCPGCGETISPSAISCRSCRLNLQTGRCAACGASVSVRAGRPSSESDVCHCRTRPIVFGSFQFPALCTHCGRSVLLRPGWLARLACRGSAPHPQLACPYCAVDWILAKAESRGVKVDLLRNEDRHETNTVLEALDKLISQLSADLKPIRRDAIREILRPNFGKMASAVVGATLLGNPAAGVAFANGTGESAGSDLQAMEAELYQELCRAKSARKRLAKALAARR